MSLITSPATSNRVVRDFALRTQTAGQDAFTPAPAQNDNGDEALYADKSGTYTKGILQTDVGLVDLAAYQTFKRPCRTATQRISKRSHWVERAP